MKSDLFIRADGSTDMGLGHLVRCISLSYMLKQQFNITFFCKKIPRQIEKELERYGITLQKIDQETQFIAQLRDDIIVVLDGYFFDADYQKKVRQSCEKLVCIDDLHDKEFFADLIINHAPGIPKEKYLAQSYTKYALGVDYALLRPPFLEADSETKRSTTGKSKTILICYGGSDSENLTLKTLKIVSASNQFKKIIIVTGSSYPYEQELLQEMDEENVEYHHALSGEEMAEAFLKSDVAIVPSSGILFEALATGNIAISGTYTDNQKEVYCGFKSLDAIIDAGDFVTEKIEKAIQQIDTFKIPKAVIDGKSPERVRMLFKNLKGIKKERQNL